MISPFEQSVLLAEHSRALEERRREAAAQGKTTATGPSATTAQGEGARQRRPPSEARLRAQRANAQRSTGPRTARGKRRSAMNGLKFGSFEEFLRRNGYPVADLRRIWRDLAAIFWFVDPMDRRFGSIELCALSLWSKLNVLRGGSMKTNGKTDGKPTDSGSARGDLSEIDRSAQLQRLDSAIEGHLASLVTRYASGHRHWRRRLLKQIGPDVLSGGTRPLRLAVEARLEAFQKWGPPLQHTGGTNPTGQDGPSR